VLPEIVLRSRKRNLNKWPPFRPLRFANQTHVRFTREPVALSGIASDAGANHVLPGGRPPAVARHDVIQIELAPIEELAAVLAGVLVSLKHVVSGEFYFLLRKPIEHKQHDNQLSKSCVEKLFASSEETIWACPAYTSEKARRAEQMFTACQSRLSTKT